MTDIDTILNKVQDLFGDNIVDPEIFPKQATFQFTVARWELENPPQEKVDTEQPT